MTNIQLLLIPRTCPGVDKRSFIRNNHPSLSSDERMWGSSNADCTTTTTAIAWNISLTAYTYSTGPRPSEERHVKTRSLSSSHRENIMPPPTSRTAVLKHLYETLQSGQAIIGAGAGTGISAKCIEAGGADLIIIYNSGRFRMAGRGSLAGLMPYGDANAVVVDMAREVLPVVERTGVLAGVCGTDPFRVMGRFLAELKAMGFCGVQNFPTVGLIDGNFRANLEETGMGYDKEVEMVRLAHEMDLLTTPYVFDAEEAEKMTRVGADVLVAHMGLTSSGTIGAAAGMSLDECVALIQRIRDRAVELNPDILVLCHGGPIAEPKDAEYVLSRTRGVHGFFGASSMERLPVEIAIRNTTAEFKALTIKDGKQRLFGK